jgi:hypothetical protein
MVRKITREQAINIAVDFVRRTYGTLAGLRSMVETRFGRVNWIVVLEGGFPICRRFTTYVNGVTGEITKPIREEKCKSSI